MSLLWAAVFTLAGYMHSSSASAEEVDEVDEVEENGEESIESPATFEARALFEAGMAAYDDDRPADAQDLLRRSLQIDPAPPAAFNLALALRATNDLVEAVRTLERLLLEEFGELGEEQHDQVAELRQEIFRRLGTLYISAVHSSPVVASVDGLRLGIIDPGERLDHLTMPGTHVVSGSAEGVRLAEQTVEAVAGVETSVVLTLEADESRPRRWWIWLLTGTIVVATATALALWLTLREPDQETNPLWGGTIEALEMSHRR